MDEVEITEEIAVKLEEKRTELVKIIESFETLEKSKEWATLKELVFDKDLSSIERRLFNAATEFPLDMAKIYSLQGERLVARKYDKGRFVETLKKQLADINKKIK